MRAAEAGDIVPDRPGNGVILHVGHVGLFRRSILFDGLRLLGGLFRFRFLGEYRSEQCHHQ